MRIYFDVDPQINDLAPMPVPAPERPARRPRRGLRNWQTFVICYVPIMAGIGLLQWDNASPLTAIVGLLLSATTMLITLTLAGRAGRL